MTTYQIPVSNDPCISFTVPMDTKTFMFRTYWCGNITNRWLCDIRSSDDLVLLSGIVLNTGCANLLEGCGLDALSGCTMYVVDNSGNMNKTIDGLGVDAFVYFTVA